MRSSKTVIQNFYTVNILAVAGKCCKVGNLHTKKKLNNLKSKRFEHPNDLIYNLNSQIIDSVVI